MNMGELQLLPVGKGGIMKMAVPCGECMAMDAPCVTETGGYK